jgi:hypothetical protein
VIIAAFIASNRGIVNATRNASSSSDAPKNAAIVASRVKPNNVFTIENPASRAAPGGSLESSLFQDQGDSPTALFRLFFSFTHPLY